MHQIKVDIVQSEVLERSVNALRNAVVPGVVQLGGDPDLIPRDAGVSDPVADLGLIPVRKSTDGLSMPILK